MPGDVEQTRTTNKAPGMASPGAIVDDQSRRSTADMQSAIEELFRLYGAVKSITPTDSEAYDDTALQRAIRGIYAQLEDHLRRIKALERKFPIFRHAHVKAVHNDYLECVFYAPATEAEGATVLVAKPWPLRVTPFDGETIDIGGGDSYSYVYSGMYERTRTDQDGNEKTETFNPPYFLNDQILIAKTFPFVLDGDNIPIIWEDLNSAGRNWDSGFEWIDALSYLSLPSDAPDGSFGRAPSIDGIDSIMCKAVKNGPSWSLITHWYGQDAEILP